jgi:hypothetical protein
MMNNVAIYLFIKFFKEERYADQFMAGELYLNTLSYFKEVENEPVDDARFDSTEAVSMWWQPHDVIITLNVPGVGETEITSKDLAAPVSMSYTYFDFVNVYCLYAVQTNNSVMVDGKFICSKAEASEIRQQWKIDERCSKFGKFAVITPVGPFLDAFRQALKSQGHKFAHGMVEYYDDAVFHGTIPIEKVPFRKQKRFGYQQEFRVCVFPSVKHERPITIRIGDISNICRKAEASQLNGLLGGHLESILDVR